jgi:hemolysin III
LLAREYGVGFIRLLAYGGISYSVGAILEFIRAPIVIPGVIGAHELFHFAIIFAIVCHWRFIEVVVLEVSQPMGESTKSYESE